MTKFHLALLAGALTAAGPAFAEDVPDVTMTALDADGAVTRSQAIGVAGATDPATIERRLLIAARSVCGYSGMWGIRPRDEYRSCETAAIAGARRQIAARTQA